MIKVLLISVFIGACAKQPLLDDSFIYFFNNMVSIPATIGDSTIMSGTSQNHMSFTCAKPVEYVLCTILKGLICD